jgi:hypothetical protein
LRAFMVPSWLHILLDESLREFFRTLNGDPRIQIHRQQKTQSNGEMPSCPSIGHLSSILSSDTSAF